MIIEAARHVGANAQPWHYVVVIDPAVKGAIGQYFMDEQQHRAKLHMGFPTPNYSGVKTAPGLIVVAADFRFIRAFPVLNDGSELTRSPAERGATCCSLLPRPRCRRIWRQPRWDTPCDGSRRSGEEIQQRIKPLLGVPEELGVIDIMCFGPPAKPSYKRWKRSLSQILNWGSQPGESHDHRADRSVDQGDAPQSDVPRRVAGRLAKRRQAGSFGISRSAIR